MWSDTLSVMDVHPLFQRTQGLNASPLLTASDTNAISYQTIFVNKLLLSFDIIITK